MAQKFGFESLNDEIFQSKVKAKLKSKLFIGDYKSKSLCESLKTYRDVIDIENSEIEIQNDFSEFLSQIAESQYAKIFCGITKHEESLKLWTELDEETAFGKYWFQVRKSRKMVENHQNVLIFSSSILDKNNKIPFQ